MRFRINLASHPYQDAREFYERWGTALGAMVVLTLVLTGFALNEWISTRHVARQIAVRTLGDRLRAARTGSRTRHTPGAMGCGTPGGAESAARGGAD